MERVIVVGAGLAGGRACEELRRAGYSGRLTLIGAEPHLPYDRPPLSKAVLSGRTDDTTLPIDLSDVEVVTKRQATGLRPGTLDTDAGSLDYDALVIATGATPVRLPGDGEQWTLRTIDDSLALRAAIRPGLRLVIVGAGWIGAEVATTAAAAGAVVTVVEAGEAPLVTALGPAIGGHTTPWYADAGIALRLSTPVEAIVPGGVDLVGGEHLAADVVLVGVGVRPTVGWLESSGLTLDRGVVVDGRLRAAWNGADGPPVVAVGDCSAWWSARYGERLRVEHWDAAQTAPVVAASTLTGGEAIYDPVPYVWSNQFGRMLQYAGHRAGETEAVWRGDPSSASWSVGWFTPDGHLTAIFAVKRPRDIVAARKLMVDGGVVDRSRFADPDVAVKDLATSLS